MPSPGLAVSNALAAISRRSSYSSRASRQPVVANCEADVPVARAPAEPSFAPHSGNRRAGVWGHKEPEGTSLRLSRIDLPTRRRAHARRGGCSKGLGSRRSNPRWTIAGAIAPSRTRVMGSPKSISRTISTWPKSTTGHARHCGNSGSALMQQKIYENLMHIVRKRPRKADSRIYLLLLSFEGLASKTEEGSALLN